MIKNTWQNSHTFLRKALYFIALAVLFSVSLLALPRATQATDFNYTFDIKKNNQSVLRKTTSGNVVVGINMNSDKNLSNIRFYVDGKLKATRANIVNTGFREFYTWNTKEETNGEHTVSIKAVKTNGSEFDVWTTSGNTSSKLTINNGANGGTGSSGGGSGSASGSGSSGSATATAAESNAQVTAKPKLTVEPGPMDGVAGSKSGTVNGDKVTGGIVFKVQFKRPKTENYDLKTMHVDITKDGQSRITMYKSNDKSIEVAEEGNFKIYTFRRYYITLNKPNGANTWVASFQPNVPTPAGDTQSDPLILNIDNPDSTAEQTCRDLKTEVNTLFNTMTARVDKVQAEVEGVNTRINTKYTELNLATSNPIPDYEAKKARNTQLSSDVNTKQTEAEALKLTCARGSAVEDAGAQVVAFKTKYEEAKGAMSVYRAATLDLLGELRTRLPDNSGGGDDDDVVIPAGFVKYNTPCYSFAARRGFTTGDPTTQLKGPCNKEVTFSKTQSDGLGLSGQISPRPWPLTNGTLAQNVEQVKSVAVANGGEIVDERSFTLDGRNAVRFVSRFTTAAGTEDVLHVLVEAPYKIDGVDVGGYEIYIGSYSHTGSANNVRLGNFVKDATDKALATWRWKDDNNGGGNGGGNTNTPVPGSNATKVACVDNLTDGARVQTVYIKVAGAEKGIDDPTRVGGKDYTSTRDFVKRSTARMNREVIESADSQGGFRQFRFATESNCEVNIQQITIEPAEANLSFGQMLPVLVNKYGLSSFDKTYLVYLDHTIENLNGITCGIATSFFTDPTKFRANKENPDPAINSYNNGSVGIGVFPRNSRNALANASRECWVPFAATGNTKPSDVQLHELMHTLGAVQASAPNGTNNGHCSDGKDNMCYDDQKPGDPPVNLRNNVCTQPRANFLLDCRADDYFNINPSPGSYLTTHWNTANSKWFTASRGNAQ